VYCIDDMFSLLWSVCVPGMSLLCEANKDWAEKLGYSTDQLNEVNVKSIDMLKTIRDDYESSENGNMIVISGCVGPRGDGYIAGDKMTPCEALQYHVDQIRSFSETAADVISAMTMTYAEEAIGISMAAKSQGMPVVIAFTVETDGSLPSGQLLEDAIAQVDRYIILMSVDQVTVYCVTFNLHAQHNRYHYI
jgi:S-methylmethionine-dependent homocysteine/selenocysteine methylase